MVEETAADSPDRLWLKHVAASERTPKQQEESKCAEDTLAKRPLRRQHRRRERTPIGGAQKANPGGEGDARGAQAQGVAKRWLGHRTAVGEDCMMPFLVLASSFFPAARALSHAPGLSSTTLSTSPARAACATRSASTPPKLSPNTVRCKPPPAPPAPPLAAPLPLPLLPAACRCCCRACPAATALRSCSSSCSVVLVSASQPLRSCGGMVRQ